MMIENQVHSPTKLSPTAVPAASAKIGDTTAFESLMSALAVEARRGFPASRDNASAARGAISARERLAAAAPRRNTGVPSPAELAKRATERAADKMPNKLAAKPATKPSARPEATRPEQTETAKTTAEKTPAAKPAKPQRVVTSQDSQAEVPDSQNMEARSAGTNPAEDFGNTSATTTATEATTPAADSGINQADLEAMEEALAAELSGNPGVAAPVAENLAAELAPQEATPPLNDAVSEFPANTAAQAALAGKTDEASKAPAMDGAALMQDIRTAAVTSNSEEIPVLVPTESDTSISGVTTGDVTGMPEAPVDPMPEVPTPWPDAVNNSGGVLGTSAAGGAGVATGFAPMTPANVTTEAGNASISGVNGTAGNATASTPAAAPAATASPIATAPSTPVNPSAPTFAPNLTQQVFDLLQHHLGRLRNVGLGVHQLRLAIKPEAFGPVRVAVHFQADGAVQMQLLAANEAAREQLRQVLGEIRRDLASTGLQAQLDLAESDQHFAEFTSAGGGDSQGENPGRGTGPQGQEAGGVNTTEESQDNVRPQVGDVLKDGSDGSVDMFA